MSKRKKPATLKEERTTDLNGGETTAEKIIRYALKKVKPYNALNELMRTKGLSETRTIGTVKAKFRNFNRQLLYACKHTDTHGVELCKEAFELLQGVKPIKQYQRRQPCRVSCRLTTETYARLTAFMLENHYSTMQEALTRIILNTITKEK